MAKPADGARLVGLKFNHMGTMVEPYYCIREIDGEYVCSVTSDEVSWPEIDGEDYWEDDLDEGGEGGDSGSTSDPYSGFGASVATASAEDVVELQAALEDAGVLSWNGYDESYSPPEGVLDMDDRFIFKMLYSDGTLVFARGYNSTPAGYDQVVGLLLDFFEAHADRSASYPSTFPDAKASSMIIDLGSPYGNGPRWRIELWGDRKQWIVNLHDPDGAVLPAGTDISDYAYVESADELPFGTFMGILRAHGVEAYNLEEGWEGGGEGCQITIFFENGQAFDMNTNAFPDYEPLRDECVQAMYDYYQQVRA